MLFLSFVTKIYIKRVQSNGRADLYRNDDLFRTNVKMIGALGFVPIVSND